MTRWRPTAHRIAPRRLSRRRSAPSPISSPGSKRRSGAAGQRRRRHAGLDLAADRARPGRQLDLAQRPCRWPSTSPRTSGRPVRLANDANCFALSEAIDGAGAGARSVFGVILGTGCGGGLVFDGGLIDGPNAHRRRVGPQPAALVPAPTRHPGPLCWCGRRAAWKPGYRAPPSPPTMPAPPATTFPPKPSPPRPRRRRRGACNPRPPRRSARPRPRPRRQHLRSARDRARRRPVEPRPSLRRAARLVAPHVFAAAPRLDIRPPRWGDASGVRGAARLW